MNIWTTPDSYGGFNPIGQYCLMSRHRDSDLLSESNWFTAIQRLKDVYPELDDNFEGSDENDTPMAYTWRAGHWAVGWVEYLMIRSDAPQSLIDAGQEIADKIESYPVLDENDWSEREYEATCDYWEHASVSERVDMCRDAGVSIFAARRDSMHADDGRLFDWVRERIQL